MSKNTKRNANNYKYNHGLKNIHNYKQSPEKQLLTLAIHTLRHTSDIFSEISGMLTFHFISTSLLIYYLYKFACR
jgi:hypothetical protein